VTRVDPNDHRPPYQQIADDLRRAIASGTPAPGVRLDSTRDLAVKYGVAAMTVHQAIRLLRDEGLVESWQGRGTFVRAAPSDERPADLPAQVRELRQRVDQLADNETDVDAQLADLRRQLASSQAQIMELYARAGLPYPHDQTTTKPNAGRGRRASGE
jgi:DNA-binding GntR family transcriptional regulator